MMETFVQIRAVTKREVYEELIPQLKSLIADESDLIANLANTASVLKLALRNASWVGFYLMKQGELVLGPFQGKPACVRIQVGRGVCGSAIARAETLTVPDVQKFPGHICCDPDSRSEIVVPMFRDKEPLGVLDLDSASIGAFDETDKHYLERIVALLIPKF
jgi:GAF domain-containing protein